MVPAERNLVPAGAGTRDTHGDRHCFAAQSPEPDPLRPGMDFKQQFGQLDFVRRIGVAHRSRPHPADHRLGHIRVGVPENRRSHPEGTQVDEPSAVEIHDLAALGLLEVSGPLPGHRHLLAKPEEPRRARNDLLRTIVLSLSNVRL